MTDHAASRNMVPSVSAACQAEASSFCAKMPAYTAILVLFLDAILVASIVLALDLAGFFLIIMVLALVSYKMGKQKKEIAILEQCVLTSRKMRKSLYFLLLDIIKKSSHTLFHTERF